MPTNQSAYDEMCEVYQDYLCHKLVRVVRCKNCKWKELCEKTLEYKGADGYCSKGEMADREMSREEAIKRLEEGAPFSELYDSRWEAALAMAIKALSAEPKQAYVIVDEDGNMECSNCGSSFCFDNYCGHCGAKLIGERKDEVKIEDVIYRQNAIELAMQYCPDDDGTCSKADEDMRNLLDELEDLPSAVKHGHWEQMWEDEDQIQARCSCCGMVFWIGKGRDGNYCPNCGAKMDEEEDDAD